MWSEVQPGALRWGHHTVARGLGETGSSLTLCLCDGVPCDRCHWQCIHPLCRGAVHLPWRRWIGLCFFSPLTSARVINLQCEFIGASTLRLCAAGRYTQRQADAGSIKGLEDKNHLVDGKRRCLNAASGLLPHLAYQKKTRGAQYLSLLQRTIHLGWK